MEYFAERTGLKPDKYSLIQVKSSHQGEYDLFTYTVKTKKNQLEDAVYAQNPFLVEMLPRACTYVVRSNRFVTALEGCAKFTGRTDADEDPDDDTKDAGIKIDTLFDFNEIYSWATLNELEVIMTEKANGKFAICKVFEDMGRRYLAFGSKNNHEVICIDEMNEKPQNERNNIMNGIFEDILKNIDILLSPPIMSVFSQGYSLVGEYCDGEHFMDGDNTVSWFGFFLRGQPMETMEALGLLRSSGLQTVPYRKVFDISSDPSSLQAIFDSSLCLPGEGYVLRCRNVTTNKTVLVKVKAVGYIVKRMLRQVILRGYKHIDQIRKRFCDAYDYHKLNTAAAIRITKIFFRFGLWMMHHCYPVTVLGVTPVSAVRGKLNNGFHKYWVLFRAETASDDIAISEDDLRGSFNETEYLANTEIYPQRSNARPALVVFLQGLQGSGKSTLAAQVCSAIGSERSVFLEQDMFWGDTLSCQGAVHHAIADARGPEVIIVSRCNICPTQYEGYLRVVHALPAISIFIAPRNWNELYFGISLAGINKRSSTGDLLMIGRHEYSVEEVMKFTRGNYESYVQNPSAYLIDTFVDDKSKYALAANAFENADQLNALRLPVEQICTQVMDIISTVRGGDYSRVLRNPNAAYIAFAVDPVDFDSMSAFVNEHVAEGVLFTHHMTLEYFGVGKMKGDINDKVGPGQYAYIDISHLVIRKSDQAAAFRVSKFEVHEQREPIYIKDPHITAKIPVGSKAIISQSFVGLRDDTVIEVTYEKSIRAVCYWGV